MPLKIYNSLTRKKEEFRPLQLGKVGMYVCGVTVYDMCHIGHARSFVFFDVIFRYLCRSGYDVTYVRNFTDIDDKIINRAQMLKEDWKALAERFIHEFYLDMDALGLKRPTYEPKATEHMQQIQELIAALLSKGYAYEANGDVIYAVKSFPAYGKLSGKKTDELISGARVEVDEKKRDPLDFVLWKAAKPGEPAWDSPWGKGRPGWHIECSAMSMHYLGPEFDIHGGGADLLFPHHENEIAQSEGVTERPFARYWIHNGFVNIRSEKMSKSLGNVLNIRDILRVVHPEALRLFLLSSHYRSPLDYSESAIREASVALERLYSALAVLNRLIAAGGGRAPNLPEELTGIADRFSQAMDDDFNTPRSLAILFDAARAINRFAGYQKSSITSIPSLDHLESIQRELRDVATEVLGILTENPDDFLDRRRRQRAMELGITSEEIERLIQERARARKSKNFAVSDQIRKELADRGIILEDGPTDTTWRVRE